VVGGLLGTVAGLVVSMPETLRSNKQAAAEKA